MNRKSKNTVKNENRKIQSRTVGILLEILRMIVRVYVCVCMNVCVCVSYFIVRKKILYLFLYMQVIITTHTEINKEFFPNNKVAK